MSTKTSVLLAFDDSALKDAVAEMLACDWGTSWSVLDLQRNPESIESTTIAIIDSEEIAELLPKSASLVFLGSPRKNQDRYFDCLTERDPQTLFNSLRRAWTHREITRQNIESLYTEFSSNSHLESIGRALMSRMDHLSKLAEVRMSLVDQMPVGVIGVDEECAIVLANDRAISDLSMQNSPIWGLPFQSLFGEQGLQFLEDPSAMETQLLVHGQPILARKSPFILENKVAGTILILWKSREA